MKRQNSFPLKATVAGLFTTLAMASVSPVTHAAQGPQPTICTRSCWGARGSSGCSSMSSLNRAIIHHTAGAGDYSSNYETSKSKVRGVQNIHMDGNGWCDIGYHFLVSAGGHIFEGRSGSLSGLPRGAHDGNNGNSFGFNMLGYFHPPYNNAVTDDLRDSLYDVIAWRMPSSWSPYGSGSYNGNTVGYLDGHRKVKATACPGDGMHPVYITENYNGGDARNGVNARKNGNGGPVNMVGPDATSWGPGRIDVVVRGGGNNIFHKYYDNSAWTPFWDLGGDAFSSPSICNSGTNRLDVFVRGGGDKLYHKYFTGTAWFPTGHWEDLGGILSSGPDAVSWGPGRIDVVVRGGGNNIYHKYFDGAWSPFYNIGGAAASDPTICSWAPGRLDVFYKASNGNLMHSYYTTAAGGWSAWVNEGGTLNSSPDAVSWGPSRIDVIGRGGSNNIYQKYFNGGWSAWVNQGAVSSSDPSICSWGTNRLDIFIRGADNALHHKWFNGSWSAWESLGGTLY